MTAAILALRGFGLSLGDKKILRAINLDIPDQGVTILLGPSGTGKSTLLRTLAGLNNRNPLIKVWGEVAYQGQPLDAQQERPALVVQKITQMVSTVLESLLSNLPNRSALTRPEQLAVLHTCCDAIGQSWLMDKLNLPVVQLALHEQRALSIIRETLARPALLMLDEPTADMDEQAAGFMCQLIERASTLQPVLMISHNLAQSRQLADRVVLIASGSVQECAETSQFFDTPASESARIYLRTGSCPELSEEELDGLSDAEASDTRSEPEYHENVVETASSGMVNLPALITPTMHANSHFKGPRGFVWLIAGRLAGTPWPGIVRDTDEDLSNLADVGITHLLSLTEIPFPQEQARPHGISVSHFPIPDMQAPGVGAARDFCISLDRRLNAGAVVALHCKAGLGRTGTMLAAYWIWTNRGRVSARQAVEHIRRLESGMIQSDLQIDFIDDFSASMVMAETP